MVESEKRGRNLTDNPQTSLVVMEIMRPLPTAGHRDFFCKKSQIELKHEVFLSSFNGWRRIDKAMVRTFGSSRIEAARHQRVTGPAGGMRPMNCLAWLEEMKSRRRMPKAWWALAASR